MYSYLKCDGTIGEAPAAKRGNSSYAWKAEKKIDKYRQDFLCNAIDNTILSITLNVSCYQYDFSGCKASWQYVSKKLSPYIKTLRKLGMDKYLATLEATYEGKCHVHIISVWNKPFQTKKIKDRFYLADKELSEKISEKWINDWKKEYPLIPLKEPVWLRVCSDLSESENAFDYTSKWIGKGSNIEASIYNAEHGIANVNDVKKLFTNFWGMKLNLRLYRTARGLVRSPPFI